MPREAHSQMCVLSLARQLLLVKLFITSAYDFADMFTLFNVCVVLLYYLYIFVFSCMYVCMYVLFIYVLTSTCK